MELETIIKYLTSIDFSLGIIAIELFILLFQRKH